MRRLQIATIVLVTALAGLTVGVTSCGGTAGGVGTETGNPPVLDRLLLRLEVRAYDVEVIGEPGAVSPGGARVTVRNLRTGESTTVTAQADGSFRAALAGGLEDGYEVSVSAGGLGATVNVPDGEDPPGEPTGNAGAAGGPSSPPACDAPALLVRSCGGGACHGQGSSFGAFAVDESSPQLFLDVPSTTAGCADEGLIIDGDEPSESLLLTKVGREPPCGTQMPLGGSLSSSDVACLASWLEDFRR